MRLMNGMRTGLTALVVAVAFCACASSAAPPGAPRIVAVGDLHGDFAAYEAIMMAAGLTDKKGRWTGGETIFVQTGDLPDRGPDSLEIIRHLMKLETRARRKGGQVVLLIGNHEAMMMTGDLRYVHPGEYEAFATRRSPALRDQVYEFNRDAIEAFYLESDPALSSDAIKSAWIAETPLGKIEHQRAWSAVGEIGAWAIDHDTAVKIGDTLFVHGGLSAEYSALPLEAINRSVRTALAERDIAETSILFDPLGPLWYRGLVQREDSAADSADATPPRPGAAEEVSTVLEAFDAARIVIGHTPALDGITTSHSGQVIQIDTGIADHYGGPRTYLEITGDNVTAHNVSTGAVRALPSGRGENP